MCKESLKAYAHDDLCKHCLISKKLVCNKNYKLQTREREQLSPISVRTESLFFGILKKNNKLIVFTS